MEALITIHAACWDLHILLAPGEGYYSLSKHCLHQLLLLKLQVFALGSRLPPFPSPPPTSRSAGRSFRRGTYVWEQDTALGLQAAPPGLSCSCPAWGAGEALAAKAALPWGVPARLPLPSGRQCQPPKVSLRCSGHGLSGTKRGIRFLCLLPLSETGVNDFKCLENSDMVALYVPSA